MTSALPRLSVLDLISVRTDQSTHDALTASIGLAKRADALGYERYWVAEHHNMPAVAATNPPVLIGIIAANTSRIRVGSGGVMLPNHSPLVIAEQFAVLEAAFPGRIDLGIGRAPGSDPVISALLRSSGTTSEVNQFERNVRDISALMNPEGANLLLANDREYTVKATPSATTTTPIWLLGSSDFSARLAAQLGLPYVFAHHFSGEGTAQALELYRSTFVASDALAAPQTFLTVNAVIADTVQEAHALAAPQMIMMARLRTGQPLGPQLTAEAATAANVTDQMQKMMDLMKPRWVIDTPDAAAERIRELAARFGVDEVMISPVASAHDGADPSTAPGALRTLELLSKAIT